MTVSPFGVSGFSSLSQPTFLEIRAFTLRKIDFHPHLNDYSKLHQVPFARRGGELDVQIDFARSNQPTELSKKPVSAELIRAEFDKPPDADFFTLPFPRIQEAPWRPPF
jgi:hypothetical protein